MNTRTYGQYFWRAVFICLMVAGIYATWLRVINGLGGATNLTDQFPWGLWIGFDVLCGVGLAAGGFTLAATVHIFNLERYKPIVRPAILTAFLGYLLVIVALMFDLGKPYNIWEPLVMWNPHSVMFEVGWCVMLYTTVLALEFAPVVLERLKWTRGLKWLRAVSIPVIMLGVILSTLHQSSLGSLYLIVPHKLYPLWYTPLLPILFFISAVAVGLAMTIFESWHSARAFQQQLEFSLLLGLSRALAVVLSVLLTIRALDLIHRDAVRLLLVPRTETYLFWLEILLLAIPMVLLFRGGLGPRGLYVCSLMVIFGFISNRLNISVTGMEAGSGTTYVPRWSEVAVTLAIIALGFAIFRLAVNEFPIFNGRSLGKPKYAH